MASPPVSAVEAAPTMEAMASAPMPAAIARVPWDSTGKEHRDQDDDDPHPLLEFTSTLMSVIHGMLLPMLLVSQINMAASY